jgi:hypothetical protein
LVLLAIADFSNDDGQAWPSIPTLATKARISERHAQRVIKQLKDMGELAVHHEATKPWGTNLYQITLEPKRGDKMSPGGDLGVTGGVTSDPKRGDLGVTQSVRNRHKNHQERVEAKLPHPRSSNPGGISAHEFLELYASCAPNLPQPLKLTTGRAKKISQRLKTHPGCDFWKDVFTQANRTPFLKGENERGWKADIDWFVANDENAVKVLEGKYSKGSQNEPSKTRYRDFDAERTTQNGN